MTTTNHRPIRQAIVTKWIAPTDTKPSRVKAICERGAITVSWSHDGDTDQNHRAAMAALLAKFWAEDQAKYGSRSTGWGHAAQWHGGAIGNGLIAWVCVEAAKQEANA